MELTIEQMKAVIDEYFNKELPRLEKYFNKFAYAHEKDNFTTLVAELYIHSIDNIEKLRNVINQGNYHFYATKYIFNQRMWANSKYKKDTIVKENYSDDLSTLKTMTENDFEEDEERLLNEMDTEIKLAKIKYTHERLDLHEKILYDKYYNRGMSMRKIGNEVGVSQTAIYYMIKKIRHKIRTCKL